jgi:hypothetical protein
VQAGNAIIWRVMSRAMNDEKRNSSILGKLLGEGGDASVKLITLALVVVSGGGNLWATKETGRLGHQEAERAITELHDLHQQLSDQVQRSKRMEDMLQKLSQKQ